MKRIITVPTLGGIYKFTADSPEDEEIIRKVAKAVNSKSEGLKKMYPGKTEAEISRMIALNEGIKAARMQKLLESIEDEQFRLKIIRKIKNIDKRIEAIDYLKSESNKLAIANSITNPKQKLKALGKITPNYERVFRLIYGE